ALRLHRRERQLLALPRPGHHLRLRARRIRARPAQLRRGQRHADHRQARRQLSGHAGAAPVRHPLDLRSHADRNGFRRRARAKRRLQRRDHHRTQGQAGSMNDSAAQTELIGLDWGSSSLRAYLLDEQGGILETRTRGWGIRRLPPGGFDAALDDVLAGWPALPLLASGMVGSRDGWREVPYVDLPVGLDAVARALSHVDSAGGRRVHLIPGLRHIATADVMRGEETEIFGALAQLAVPDYLSGLLIGEELRAALAAGRIDRATPLQLIGNAPLCRRYAAAA